MRTAETVLNFLDFETGDNGEGVLTLDAMATVPAERWPALEAEVLRVLGWLQGQGLGAAGPLDEGFAWDVDLQVQRESSQPCAAAAEVALGRIVLRPMGPPQERVSLSLSLCLSEALATDFQAQFQV